MAKNYPMVAWATGTNVYEVNTRQYTPEGTFKAFEKHILRLKKMGVETLWFMPITPVSVKGRKGSLGSYYACSSYVKINEEYGTLDDFKSIIKTAHELDMKVIIDWVANHTGADHEWTVHSDYYIKNEHGAFYDKHGWDDVIDLNYDNTDMRTAMIKAMQYWITECNIDGFRCDMAHLVPLDFWRTARHECDALKPLYWLAESDAVEYLEVFDTNYGWEMMHVSKSAVNKEAPVQNLRDCLYDYSLLPGNSSKLLFTSNHDENSWNGTEYEKYGDAAKTLAVLTCTFKGVPLIYSGQEFPNHKRLKFFDKDCIEYNDSPALQDFYHTLLSYKKSHPALAQGDAHLLYTNNDNIVFYLKQYNESTAIIALNFGAEKAEGSIATEIISGNYKNIFTDETEEFNINLHYELNGWEFQVYVSL